MSTIRPYLPPAAPAPGRAPARAPVDTTPVTSAQRAFFRAAAEPSTPRAEPAAGPRRVEPGPTDRLPRPGSLLDIKV